VWSAAVHRKRENRLVLTLRSIALVVRFMIELALVAGAAIASFMLLPAPFDWIVGVIAPIVVVTIWAMWMSPKAPLSLPPAGKLALETFLVLAVGAAVWLAGMQVVAIVGFGVWVLHRIALAVTAGRRTAWE